MRTPYIPPLSFDASGSVGDQGGVRVADEKAAALVRRRLVRVLDRGLFDTPQSWACN
jgi:hypothetical protein